MKILRRRRAPYVIEASRMTPEQQRNMRRIVPLIRCTMPSPCGVCWYCKQYEAGR